MWRSHNTADLHGHYDIWHPSYPDNDSNHPHHLDPSPIQNIPPLKKKNDIRDTPCVSLHQKGRPCYHTLFLCDRPYSPFSGFYDQDDVYVGSEYDVFGGESIGPSGQTALSSSLTSTTTIDEEEEDFDHHHHHQHHHVDIFSDDPFSIPHLDDMPIINRPLSTSCGQQPLIMTTKRIRTSDHTTDKTTTFGDNDHIMALKRRKTSGDKRLEVLNPSSTNNYQELADYASCIFSPDLSPSSPMPVDSILEYN